MKTLILCFLLIGSISAHACSCMGAGFSRQDTKEAIVNFMQAKLNVEESSILEIEMGDQQHFLTRSQRVAFKIFSFLDDPETNSCGMGCARAMNAIQKHVITYRHNGKECTLPLKTKMISRFFSRGFKSIVTKKHYPRCI